MNTLYFSYALEVAKTASISQAAENLYMTQPTLSKAIKELENQLGIPIFHRTPRGAYPTEKGKAFLDYAQKIVTQLDEMDQMLHSQNDDTSILHLAVPRSFQITQILGSFISSLPTNGEMHLEIHESGFLRTIQLISDGKYPIGIVKVPADSNHYMKKIHDKHLISEELGTTFDMATLSKYHPLASKSNLTIADFSPYIEIALSENLMMSDSAEKQDDSVGHFTRKKIIINDCLAQYDLLRTIPESYMWAPILPTDRLEHRKLIQRKCVDAKTYRNLLIYRPDYNLTHLDQRFITELRNFFITPLNQ